MPKDMNSGPIDAAIQGGRRHRSAQSEPTRRAGSKIVLKTEAKRSRDAGFSDERAPGGAAHAPKDTDRIRVLQVQIQELLDAVPKKLRKNQQVRRKCRILLFEAEQALIEDEAKHDLSKVRDRITEAKGHLAEHGELDCPWVVAALVAFLFALAAAGIGMLYEAHVLSKPAVELNQITFMGIPVPVIFWSVVGSLTSVIINVGRRPIANFNDAMLLLVSRPIAGIVMGVLCYLMLAAGLLAMTGSTETQLPQLLWVVAFAGSFVDTLSERLLMRFSNRMSTAGDDVKPVSDART